MYSYTHACAVHTHLFIMLMHVTIKNISIRSFLIISVSSKPDEEMSDLYM